MASWMIRFVFIRLLLSVTILVPFFYIQNYTQCPKISFLTCGFSKELYNQLYQKIRHCV